MGLLKYALLPLFTALDLFMVYTCFIDEEMKDMMDAWGRNITELPLTNFEKHCIHALGAACLCFAFNNIMAIFFGSANHRGVALALHGIYFSIDIWSYLTMDATLDPALYVLLVLVVIGLAVHSKEPGLFTTDKEQSKSKKS